MSSLELNAHERQLYKLIQGFQIDADWLTASANQVSDLRANTNPMQQYENLPDTTNSPFFIHNLEI